MVVLQGVIVHRVIKFVTNFQTLEEFIATSGPAFNLKEALLQQLKKRLGYVYKDKTYTMATILDPRFRKMYFDKEKIAAANAVTEIGKLISPTG